MILPNELRIGNCVYFDTRLDKITSLGQTLVVAEMHSHYYYERIHPVPLTPELLEKFGFVNKPTNNYPLSFEQESGDRDLDWTFRTFWWRGDICIEPFGRDNGHIGIQYLHQLQNLYFALTGEELTVKL